MFIIIFASEMMQLRMWRNRHTRTFEGRVRFRVRVQVPSSALKRKPCKSCIYRAFLLPIIGRWPLNWSLTALKALLWTHPCASRSRVSSSPWNAHTRPAWTPSCDVPSFPVLFLYHPPPAANWLRTYATTVFYHCRCVGEKSEKVFSWLLILWMK